MRILLPYQVFIGRISWSPLKSLLIALLFKHLDLGNPSLSNKARYMLIVGWNFRS